MELWWFVIYIGLWALEEPSLVAWIFVLRLLFVVLLRCGRLPFASQLGWLGPLQQGADIGQTLLRLSLLRRQSRAAACPSSSGAARQPRRLVPCCSCYDAQAAVRLRDPLLGFLDCPHSPSGRALPATN